MSSQTKKIRDFIYLDGDKLYSLYSQVNEGVAEQISQSKLMGRERTKTQDSAVLEGGEHEAKYSDLTHSTENKVLHDFMYARLEDQIKASITELGELNPENFRETLKNSFLVKIRGTAEIVDYGRLKHILKNVNEMGQGLAYIQEYVKLGMTLYEAKSIISSIKNKADKQSYQTYIQKFDNPKRLALDYNLLQDEKQMDYFSFFSELFYLEEIEVIMQVNFDEANSIAFRGLLNQGWLRQKPDSLRMLYGGITEFDWTMVAQITYLSNPERPESSFFPNVSENNEGKQKELEETITKANENKQDPPTSMRDSILKMARAVRGIEESFMSGMNTTEIVVSPLAIYRETEIQTSE